MKRLAKKRTGALNFSYKKNQLLRAKVFAKDDFACCVCGWKPSCIPDGYDGKYTISEHINGKLAWLEVDHKFPKLYGGSHNVNNLQTLCNRCNSSKGVKLNVKTSQGRDGLLPA